MKTEFQKTLENKLRQELLLLGMDCDSQSIDVEPKHTFIKSGHLSIYIYESAAEIQGNGIDERYEDIDFKNKPNLIDDFVKEVIFYLSNPSATSIPFWAQIVSWLRSLLS